MTDEWRAEQPIYQQLRDKVVALILEGTLREGEAAPSVRKVAAQYRINPLTVMKAYQELADQGVLEKKRGRGMFVSDGAHKKLMESKRAQFLEEEWPRIAATIKRLELDPSTLLSSLEGVVEDSYSKGEKP